MTLNTPPPPASAYRDTARRLIRDVYASGYVSVTARVVGGGLVRVRRLERGSLLIDIAAVEEPPDLTLIDGHPVEVHHVTAARMAALVRGEA